MSRQLNVAHFIDNLNSIDSIDDSIDYSSSSISALEGATSAHHAAQQQQQQDEDLSIFSNTHFFDFDMGCSTDIAVSVDDLLMQQEKQLQSKFGASPSSAHVNTSGSSSSTSPSFPDTFDLQFDTQQLEDLQQFSLANELLPADAFVTPAEPIHNNTNSNKRKMVHTVQQQQQQQPRLLPAVAAAPAVPEFAEPAPKKRKASVVPAAPAATPAPTIDESNMTPAERALAEEDKRRRNTAASARFRVKKKMREQQMERAAKELQEKVQTLETKIMQLEMENKWLKNLVVEKNEARDISDLLDMKTKILASTIKTEKS